MRVCVCKKFKYAYMPTLHRKAVDAMRKLLDARDEIETEYDEPLKDVIQGFFKQGESCNSTAGILEVDPASLRTYATDQKIIQYAPGITKHRMPRTVEENKRIARAMRKNSKIKISLDGFTGTYADWSDRLGISRKTLQARFARGMSPDEALQVRLISKSEAGRRGMKNRWKKCR